jgi:hypothetical protein
MKVKVELHIRSDVLTDSRIARLMRLQPTPNTLAGRKHRTRWKSHKRGQWKLRLAEAHTIGSAMSNQVALAKIIRKLCARITAREIAAVSRADPHSWRFLEVHVWEGEPTCGFSIEPNLLREISDMGLTLDVTSWIGFGEMVAGVVGRRVKKSKMRKAIQLK